MSPRRPEPTPPPGGIAAIYKDRPRPTTRHRLLPGAIKRVDVLGGLLNEYEQAA